MVPLRPHAMPITRSVQTEPKALASLALGVMSFGLGPAAGLPAMILGAVARRDIERADGRLTGRGFAAGGIVAGLFGSGIGLVLMLSLLGTAFSLGVPEAPAPKTAAAVTRPAARVAPVHRDVDDYEHAPSARARHRR